MAATYPSGDPDETRDDRPTLSPAPATRGGTTTRWIAIAIGIVVLVAIAALAYALLYNGGGGGGTGGGQNGGGGGGYLVLAFSGEAVRRIASKLRH